MADGDYTIGGLDSGSHGPGDGSFAIPYPDSPISGGDDSGHPDSNRSGGGNGSGGGKRRGRPPGSRNKSRDERESGDVRPSERGGKRRVTAQAASVDGLEDVRKGINYLLNFLGASHLSVKQEETDELKECMTRFLDAWFPEREGSGVIPPKFTTPFLLLGVIYTIVAPRISGLKELPERKKEETPSENVHPFPNIPANSGMVAGLHPIS